MKSSTRVHFDDLDSSGKSLFVHLSTLLHSWEILSFQPVGEVVFTVIEVLKNTLKHQFISFQFEHQ